MQIQPARRPWTLLLSAALTCCVALTSAQSGQPGASTSPERWVPTWGTAQQLIRVATVQGRGGQASAPPSAAAPAATSPGAPPTATPPAVTPIQDPTGQTPASATQPPPAAAPPAAAGRGGLQTLTSQTVRMIVRTSIGGRRVRVKLSNAFGGPAVTVGAAYLARRGKGPATAPGSDRPLTFAGQRSFRMPPGAVVISDPVDLDVPPLTDLAVSLYFPGETGPPTTHATGLRTTYISTAGDFSAHAEMPVARTTTSYYWLSSVEVAASADAAVIVAFGDSITDGARSTPDTGNTWPALLAARLAANKATAHIGVINQGIGGNRVLTDSAGLAGVNALARLDRDALSHPGVKWLMLLEGINDIGSLAQASAPFRPTAADLIWAYQQIITRAHAHGIKVIGCTLTPYGGAGYHTEEGEAIREAVNQWIRTSKAFDAVVDFDAATRDAGNPKQLRPEYDPGDRLHPNDAGYKAMADAVDLTIFTAKAPAPMRR